MPARRPESKGTKSHQEAFTISKGRRQQKSHTAGSRVDWVRIGRNDGDVVKHESVWIRYNLGLDDTIRMSVGEAVL